MMSQKKKPRSKTSLYHRTSITLPVAVAQEIDRRRGKTSFSGQISSDLNAYLIAVGCGMVLIKNRFTMPESRLLIRSLFGTRWDDRKLDEAVLAEVIEKVRTGGITNKSGDDADLNLDELFERLDDMSMIELLALFDLIRISQQRYGKPQKAAASCFGAPE